MAMDYYLNFIIIKDKNDTLISNYQTFRAKLPYDNDFVTINPDKSFSEIIDLTKYYSDDDSVGKWKNGLYSLQCSYKYKYNKPLYGKDFWEGEISSNTIQIKIE